MAAEVNKPDFSYQWASGGAIVAPSNVKVQTGWTAEVPPFQWENWSQNRQDNAILHIFQKGISEWDALSNYYFTASGVRSYVQGSDGNIYVAVADSLGQNPVTDATDTYWKLAFTSTNPNIGSATKVRMSITTASASATITAEEVIVGSAIGGLTYKLSTYSKAINLATVGAGGMDTGTAPVNGYVALYAIYNPLSGASSVVAKDATLTAATTTYTGANMPSGYTASALLTVVPTNGSSQFKVVEVFGRKVKIALATVYSGNASVVNNPISISGAVPLNAIEVSGEQAVGSSALSTLSLTVFGGLSAVGQQNLALTVGAGQTVNVNYAGVPIITPQVYYFTSSSTAGTPVYFLYISEYLI